MTESREFAIVDFERGGAGKPFIAVSSVAWAWRPLRGPVRIMIDRRAGLLFAAMRDRFARDESADNLPAGVRTALHDRFHRTDSLWRMIALDFNWPVSAERDTVRSFKLSPLTHRAKEEVV